MTGPTIREPLVGLVERLRRGRLVRASEPLTIEGHGFGWTGEVREMAHPDALEAATALEEQSRRIEELEAALEPFAEVADWAARNGHDLVADFDMLLRGPGYQIAGHLHAQATDFVAARTALSPSETVET